MILHRDFDQAKKLIFNNLNLEYSELTEENEGHDYGAGYLKLSNLFVILRSSKITPKKVGQFVTLWKRNNKGVTRPYDLSDKFDLLVINVRKDNLFGQFVFTKDVLVKKGIITTPTSSGKRGFRIYPPWDNTSSTQAKQTQKWQQEYFLAVNNKTNFNLAKKLYLLTTP